LVAFAAAKLGAADEPSRYEDVLSELRENAPPWATRAVATVSKRPATLAPPTRTVSHVHVGRR